MYGYVRKGNSQPAWLFPFVVIIVTLLTVLPLARLAVAGIEALLRGGAYELITDPAIWRAAWYTIETALLGTVISVLLGCLFAFLLTLTDIPGRGPLGFLFVL